MIKISVVKNPDRKIAQSVLYFQFRFMGWTKKTLANQNDRYGSLPFVCLIAKKDKELVGVANLFKRDVLFKRVKVKLGGIGGFCVHENFRRQGIGLRLIEKGMEFLRAEGLDVAYLCTDIKKLGELYSRVGFQPLGRKYVSTGASGRRYKGGGGMIAPLNSKEKFDLILSSEKEFDLQGQDW